MDNTVELFKKGYDLLDQIESVFKCMICMQKPRDSHICGYCSKFCCFQCAQEHLKHPQSNGKCPYCKENLVDKLVRVTWMNEMGKLDELKMVMVKNEAAERKNAQILGDLISSKGESEYCSFHNQPLNLICQNCKIVICLDCCGDVMHSGHIYKTVIQEYSYSMISLNKQYHDVESCSKKYTELIEKNMENLQGINWNKDKMLLRIKYQAEEQRNIEKKAYIEKLQAIDDKFLICVKNICEQEKYKRIKIENEINEFTKVRDDLESFKMELGKLKNSAMCKIVGKQQKILERTLDELRKTSYATRMIEIKSARLYETKVEFLLLKTSQLTTNQVSSGITTDFKGNSWCLKVQLSDDKTSIGCFLELVNPKTPIEVKFCIQMIHQDTNKIYESESLEKIFFDKGSGLVWGFQQFIRLHVAINFLNRQNDSLKLVGLVSALP